MADEENAGKDLTTAAPAVQSDELWGGPRWIHNATGAPVYVRTKEEFWALLNREGLRMQDQQESTTGPEPEKPPAPLPQDLPPPAVPPMSMEEAHIYGAMTAVFKRYGLTETIWCEHCFERHVHHGCNILVQRAGIKMVCRCGVAEYRKPAGTTDLVLNSLSLSITQNDKASGIVTMPTGDQEFRPTIVLHDMEALLIRRYVAALAARGKEPRLFHNACWSGRPEVEDEALAMSVDARDIIMICRCHMLFHSKGGSVQ